MSKFNVLSAAVVAAIAFAGPAHAYKVTSAAAPANGAGATFANLDIKDAASSATAKGLQVTLDGSDLIIGRTVGFTVKVALKDGAKFSTAVAAPATLGAALTGMVGGPPPVLTQHWVASVAAGGQIDDDYVIFKFDPTANPAGVKAGALFDVAGVDFQVKGVAGLATIGTTASADVTFADPGTAQPILTTQNTVILKSADPLDYKVAIAASNTKIDVGTGNGESKTTFSINGNINTTVDAANTQQFILVGTANLGVKAAVTAASGVAFAWVGTAGTPNAADDTVKLTLSGTSFAAFAKTTPANGANVYLVKNGGACKAAPVAGTDILAAGTVTGTQVTFANVSVADFNAKGEICFVAPTAASKVVIDATKIDTSVVVTRAASTKTATGSAAAKELVYNGPTASVDAFNPGSNAGQVSYLRITNTSGVAGKATITRTCDDGITKGSTSLNVAAGATVALTAAQLEDGGAAVATGYGACPAGQKARLDISGEFDGMKVQNFLRNTSTIINTNVNNNN